MVRRNYQQMTSKHVQLFQNFACEGFPKDFQQNLVSQHCFNVILLLKHVVGCI